MPALAKDSDIIISSSSAKSAGLRPATNLKKKPAGTTLRGKTGTPDSKPKKRRAEGQIRVPSTAEVEASSCSSTPASRRGGAVAVYSECRFPMTRVRRLMDGSEGASRSGSIIRPTHEAVFLANKATELFLELFAQDANACARRDRKKSISYKHLSSNVYTKKRYEFLSDFVPEKLKAEDALKAKTSADE